MAVRDTGGMAILTPDQRLRVFISSTLTELAAERAVVRDAIERLRLQPVMFEMGARPHPPRALYRAYLEQSAIFIGLYWERYGWIAEDMDVSGLEDEYQLSVTMPRLLYIKEPAPRREPRLAKMVEQMSALPDATPGLFATAAELAERVADDLARLLSGHFGGRRQPTREAAVTAPQPTAEPLPSALTSFVGRSQEVAEVQAMLRRDDVRLVTLAGMGGMGKTRLALEVARTMDSAFPDGVHLVRLASVRQPDLVIPTIASALGIRVEEKSTADAGLIEALAGRRMLLILDNFEQVADAAPAIGTLLESAPDLHLLVTSRRLLHLSAEHEYQVPTLSLPADDKAARPEEVGGAEAVQLFVERAAAVRPGFRLSEDDTEAVAEIVRRLDGVPLAIELAAARTRLLPPAALLARLDRAVDVLAGGLADLPERQRSLRATLDWSFSLLDADEQQFVARLSTFVGGWTLEAAETVCAADDEERLLVLDRLAGLVDNSLVIVELSEVDSQARFRMLEPVREYAREKLIDFREHEVLDRRHMAYFEAMTEQAGADLPGPQQQRWLDILEREAGNLGAAASRALEWGEPGRLIDVAWRIWIWLWLNDHVTEARHWLEPVQAKQRGQLAPLHRARLDWVLGCLYFEHGHFDRAGPLLHASVAAFTELGDDSGRALALLITGGVLPYEGEDDACVAYLTEAADLLRAGGDYFSASIGAGALGMHWLRRGDVEKAEAFVDVAARDVRAIDNAAMGGLVRLYEAFVRIGQGHLGQARQLLATVIAESGRRSDEVLAYGFDGMAGVAVFEGDAARAATLLGIAHGLRVRAALTIWPDMQPLVDGLIAGAKAAIGEEEFDIAWKAGASLDRAGARAFALGRAAVPAGTTEPGGSAQ